MATIFSDGFESGDFSAWTGTTGTPTVVSNPHHGDYACEFSKPAWTSKVSCNYDFGSDQDELNCRAYVYIDTWEHSTDNTGASILEINRAGVTGIAKFGILRDGASYYWAWKRFGVSWTSTGVLITEDEWVCLELHFVSTASGEIELYLNGASIYSDTGSWAYETDEILIGSHFDSGGHGDACLSYMDCVVAADAYIGPEAAGGVGIPVVMHHRRMMGVSCLPFSSRFPKWKPNITI